MMKKIISFVALVAVCGPALALAPTVGRGRRAAADQMMAAPRATASINQLNSMAVVNAGASAPVAIATTDKSSLRADAATTTTTNVSTTPTEEEQKDMREKEKAACTMNNIGVGNTFVWASRYSNLNNYSSMVEDIDEPANNTCFVRVEMRSDDSKINVSDVPGKYFEMGQTITCGAWADEKALEKRILDAKKNARTWATVGGTVGGAAVGVGAMELFGNKLIGGKVEGQKALKDNDLLASQLKVLKNNKETSTLNEIRAQLTTLKAECGNDTLWKDGMPEDVEKACKSYEYDRLLGIIDG